MERGGGGGEGRSDHQNDSCIKMGSDESHFKNVSLIVRDKSQESVHKPQHFLKRKESRSGIEPRLFCLKT